MKTELALEGFSEISMSEQQEINGGIWPIIARILVGAAVAAATEIIDDWDNFKNGLQGLPETK
ncbi:MAG: class IIb bacteriocin, lactobin A/cerein 7B family [Bacteroides sp.]|nr:class IIb bacteriocin, lactobin A/cerein 7B family [Bacteroides sp.]